VALGHLRAMTAVATVCLLGASFGGGLCAYYAAKRQAELDRLVLLNPNLTYNNRRVLAVGFGSGWNVRHCPPEVPRVIAVDPVTVGRDLAASRLARSSVPVEFVH